VGGVCNSSSITFTCSGRNLSAHVKALYACMHLHRTQCGLSLTLIAHPRNGAAASLLCCLSYHAVTVTAVLQWQRRTACDQPPQGRLKCEQAARAQYTTGAKVSHCYCCVKCAGLLLYSRGTRCACFDAARLLVSRQQCVRTQHSSSCKAPDDCER
jgi:hypothetical protein